MERKSKMVPLPDYGDHMTLIDFQECVKSGLFTPYDGSGCWATKDEMDDYSDVWSGPPPSEWATHVVWFNK